MSEPTPFERYVEQVQAHLTALPAEQRERVERELQQHLEDAAQQANADPHDPQFQRTLIAQMGSSRRLGREMARAYRPAAYWQYRIASIAALCSSLAVLGTIPMVYLLRNKEIFYDMLFAAPVVLVPTMLVLHLIYQPLRPRMSWWTLVIGLIGAFAFFMTSIYPHIVMVIEKTRFAPLGLDRALYMTRNTYLIVPLIGLIGVWYILIGLLSRKTRIPDTSEFSWMSIIAGSSFLCFFLFIFVVAFVSWLGGFVSGTSPIIQTIFLLLLLTWALCHMSCTGIAAIWLAERANKPSAPTDNTATA